MRSDERRSEADADSDANTDAHSDTDADSQTDTNADAQADADSDAQTDADSDSLCLPKRQPFPGFSEQSLFFRLCLGGFLLY